MKYLKTVFLLIIFSLSLHIALANNNLIIINADTVWNTSITNISNDAIDSTDASPVNSDLFVVNADTIWNIVPTIMPEDTLDSTDASPVNSDLLIVNADTI